MNLVPLVLMNPVAVVPPAELVELAFVELLDLVEDVEVGFVEEEEDEVELVLDVELVLEAELAVVVAGKHWEYQSFW